MVGSESDPQVLFELFQLLLFAHGSVPGRNAWRRLSPLILQQNFQPRRPSTKGSVSVSAPSGEDEEERVLSPEEIQTLWKITPKSPKNEYNLVEYRVFI